MSEADVWGNFECMKEVLEDFMRQAGALQGLLQEALAGRQDLCDAEGGSKGWSDAEVLFMQRACSEEDFMQAAGVGIRSWSKAAVRQQALVVERFMQEGAFLKVCLHEAVKGVQDRAEAGCRPEALRTAGEAARRRGAGEAAVWEASLNEEIEAMGRAMAAAEQAGASEDLLVEARSMLADMASTAGSQRDVEVVSAPPTAEAARASGTCLGSPGALCKGSGPTPLRLGLWTPTAAPWASIATGRAPLGAARAGFGAELRQASGPVSTLWTPRSGTAAAGLNSMF